MMYVGVPLAAIYFALPHGRIEPFHAIALVNSAFE